MHRRLGHAEPRILEALVWLLDRPLSERPFVIVQALSDDDRFVQFATTDAGVLLLDLPSPNLDRAARDRAEEFLEPVESPALRQPWSLRKGATTYQMACATADLGVTLAMRVMRYVHAVADDTDVLIVRSWAS